MVVAELYGKYLYKTTKLDITIYNGML